MLLVRESRNQFVQQFPFLFQTNLINYFSNKKKGKLKHLANIFLNCANLEEVKDVRPRCFIVVNCVRIMDKYPIEPKDSYNPRMHKNVDELTREFRVKMDQAIWKICSKLRQLSWVLARPELSSVAQLKVGTEAIRSVLQELKHIKPDSFLQ